MNKNIDVITTIDLGGNYDEHTYYEEVENFINSFLGVNLSVFNSERIRYGYNDIAYKYNCHGIILNDPYVCFTRVDKGEIFLIKESELPEDIPWYLIRIF